MECETCSIQFDLNARAPLVLQCGHTFCKTCITRSVETTGRLQCLKDRTADSRQVSQLPRNFALVEALKLDLEADALARGLNVGRELWLDERELELSNTELGSGASGRVVEGTYQGKEVSTCTAVQHYCMCSDAAAYTEPLHRSHECRLDRPAKSEHHSTYINHSLS